MTSYRTHQGTKAKEEHDLRTWIKHALKNPDNDNAIFRHNINHQELERYQEIFDKRLTPRRLRYLITHLYHNKHVKMKDEETLEYSTEFLDYFSKKNFPTKTTQENFDDLIQDSINQSHYELEQSAITYTAEDTSNSTMTHTSIPDLHPDHQNTLTNRPAPTQSTSLSINSLDPSLASNKEATRLLQLQLETANAATMLTKLQSFAQQTQIMKQEMDETTQKNRDILDQIQTERKILDDKRHQLTQKHNTLDTKLQQLNKQYQILQAHQNQHNESITHHTTMFEQAAIKIMAQKERELIDKLEKRCNTFLQTVQTHLDSKIDKAIAHFQTEFDDRELTFTNTITQHLDSVGSQLQFSLEEEKSLALEDLEQASAQIRRKSKEELRTLINAQLPDLIKRSVDDHRDTLMAPIIETTSQELWQLKANIRKEYTENLARFNREVAKVMDQTTDTIQHTLDTKIQPYLNQANNLSEQPTPPTTFTPSTPDVQPPTDQRDIIYNPYMRNTSQSTNTWRHKSTTTESSNLESPTNNSPSNPDSGTSDRFSRARDLVLIQTHIPKFDKAEIYVHLPPINTPNQQEMEAFYATVSNKLNSNNIPIVQLEDLQPRSSCIPMDARHRHSAQVITRISQSLYHKLMGLVPITNTCLKDILGNHSTFQDGYGALYEMMRATCPYLGNLQPKWGPKWEPHMSAHAYANALRSHAIAEARTGRNRTDIELAIEMVQQAQSLPTYQNLATAYLSTLIALPDPAHLPVKFQLNELALDMETHKQAQKSLPIPSINKINRPPQKQPPRTRTPIQCQLCKTFGHCISRDQICRIGAQVYHVLAFQKQEPAKFTTNAATFAKANEPRRIQMAKQRFPTLFSDNDQSSNADEICYELAATFWNDSDADSNTSTTDNL